MSLSKLFLLLLLLMSANIAIASDEEAAGEKKAHTPEKPSPDSAISVVLQLPEVQDWEKYINAGKDGAVFTIWGESVESIDGNKCWGVVVGKITTKRTSVLKRFCVMQAGRDVWVEGAKNDSSDEVNFIQYEKWRDSCKPTARSTGTCYGNSN